jgi:hypothetical protein
MNKFNKGSMETQPSEGSIDEAPFQPVEGLGQINFEKECLLSPILQVEGMNDFLSDDDIG